MGPNDKPLLSREDLIDAIQRHFVLEMKVDHHEEIGKFLSLKREEARSDLVIGPRRGGDKPRNLRNRGNPKPNNQMVNNQQAIGGGNSNIAPKQAASVKGNNNDSAANNPKTRGGGAAAANNQAGAGANNSTIGKRSTATATPNTCD